MINTGDILGAQMESNTMATRALDTGISAEDFSRYVTQMQSTIDSSADTVNIITVLAAIVGVVFTVWSLFLQWQARREIAKIRSEVEGNLRSSFKSYVDEAIAEQVKLAYSKDIYPKLDGIAKAHESDHLRIENLVMTFQHECQPAEGGNKGFNFIKCNEFRYLLSRMIGGETADRHGSLSLSSRILAEFSGNVQRSTAILLGELVQELREEGRFSRREQHDLAQKIIERINGRFGPPKAD